MSPEFMIIDGSSLIHRAFYALPPLSNAAGQYTNAVYGFTTMLLKLLADLKPDAIAVAFDKGRITFRNETYAAYKGHRKATPGELSEQFPLVKEVLTAFGIQVLEEAGYEADDIIGTLSVQAVQAGCQVTIVTGDRDALQLIGPHSKVLLTKKGISEMDVFTETAFQEKYGITSNQFIDVKGLMGDTSDNIPGVPGIGEKTAVKLINEFGSVENLLDNIDRVAGKKLQENLRTYHDMAVMSKKLATIVCDMPLAFSLDQYGYAPDTEKLKELFAHFEFKSLLQRLPAMFGNAAGEPATEPVRIEARLIETREAAEAVATAARRQGRLVFYPVMEGTLPAIIFAGLALWDGTEAVYIPTGSDGWSCLTELLADERVEKVTYDAKVTYNACCGTGLACSEIGTDILLMAYLLDPTAVEYPLDKLAAIYLSGQAALHPDQQKDRIVTALWSAEVIARLQPVLYNALQEAQLENLYREIELPLARVLSSMENYGITVDRASLLGMSEKLSVRIDGLLKDIYELAGEPFNVNSTKQLGVLLFEKLKLPVIKKTKTGYSTDAEVLEKLAGSHPLIGILLEYRMLIKLKSTYLDGLLPLIHPVTRRIHTTFNQTVTATGRLSSSEPNLQNIPIRSEAGRKIRELFVPGDGYDYIMSADYSQIELRILAHMSQDSGLIEAFNHEQDIHTRTAAEVFGVPMGEVTPEMRSRAKAVNFGIVYGISDYGLSRDIGVSRKEAGQYIESYFARYRGVKEFIDAIIHFARQNGYVTTLFDRRRYLPEINSSNFNQRSFAERTAMNTPIQGTAADIIKKAMLDVERELSKAELTSRILLQVHDELLLEVVEQEKELVSRLVKQAMEQTVSLLVPMTVEVKTGKTWAAAK